MSKELSSGANVTSVIMKAYCLYVPEEDDVEYFYKVKTIDEFCKEFKITPAILPEFGLPKSSSTCISVEQKRIDCLNKIIELEHELQFHKNMLEYIDNRLEEKSKGEK